jgi:hypothetical protein
MAREAMNRRNIGHLENSVRKVRREASRVSLQRFVASFLPRSRARASLSARHAALLKMAEHDQAEIERIRNER